MAKELVKNRVEKLLPEKMSVNYQRFIKSLSNVGAISDAHPSQLKKAPFPNGAFSCTKTNRNYQRKPSASINKPGELFVPHSRRDMIFTVSLLINVKLKYGTVSPGG
jgi:hypothetical protein